VLLALFHLIIEICGWRTWAMPFVWIGMNPITIYMLHNVVDIPQIAKRFVGGDVSAFLGSYGALAVAIVGLLITLAVARFLFQRKIFLRL
jgi:hypothetical protein